MKNPKKFIHGKWAFYAGRFRNQIKIKNKIIKIYRSKLIDAKIKYKDVKSGSILKVGQNYIDVKTSDNKIRLE